MYIHIHIYLYIRGVKVNALLTRYLNYKDWGRRKSMDWAHRHMLAAGASDQVSSMLTGYLCLSQLWWKPGGPSEEEKVTT